MQINDVVGAGRVILQSLPCLASFQNELLMFMTCLEWTLESCITVARDGSIHQGVKLLVFIKYTVLVMNQVVGLGYKHPVLKLPISFIYFFGKYSLTSSEKVIGWQVLCIPIWLAAIKELKGTSRALKHLASCYSQWMLLFTIKSFVTEHKEREDRDPQWLATKMLWCPLFHFLSTLLPLTTALLCGCMWSPVVLMWFFWLAALKRISGFPGANLAFGKGGGSSRQGIIVA